LEAVLLTTELRVLGREGRSGIPDDDDDVVVGFPAEEIGLVAVIAVEDEGAPAVGAVESAFPS
jgi:hypothetical protein